MRIAHVTATFPPYYAGAGNVCYHNARLLAERGYEVDVLTARYRGENDDPPGVTVRRFSPLFRLGNAPLLPALSRITGYDLVHLHLPFIFGAELTSFAAWTQRAPLVVTYHNDLIVPGWRGRLSWLYDRTSTGLVLRLAARICAVSLGHATASLLSGWMMSDERRSTVVEIPNGVDTRRFRPGKDRRPVRARLNVPERAFLVSFVAALDEAHAFKRLDLLIDAVAQVGESDVFVVVAGDGALRAAMERRVRKRRVADRFRFLGVVPNRDLPPFLRASDVLALPSDLESFGMVLIEAMACGVPVIASDLPGVRSVVTDGVDGFLIGPGDVDALTRTIQRVRDLPTAKRRGMGMAGRRKVVSRYEWEQIGDRLDALYREVLVDRAAVYAG